MKASLRLGLVAICMCQRLVFFSPACAAAWLQGLHISPDVTSVTTATPQEAKLGSHYSLVVSQRAGDSEALAVGLLMRKNEGEG